MAIQGFTSQIDPAVSISWDTSQKQLLERIAARAENVLRIRVNLIAIKK